jgi:DNA-binding transcriptional LysR family regulator
MRLELRDVEYFSVVAEHRNVGRAAEALGLSQPALSRSLRRLESSIKAKLVTRTPKGVELTTVGSALLSHVRRLRLALNDVAHEAADLSEGAAGHLRMGVGPATAEHLLAPACSALFRSAPKISIQVTVAHYHVLLPALRNGEFDLILSNIPTPAHEDLVQQHLYYDEFVVVASATHRLAGRKQLPLAQLVPERWALPTANVLAWNWLHRVFGDHGLPAPSVAMDASSTLPTLEVVASSDLLGFASRRVLRQAKPHLKPVELDVKELKWTRSIGVSHRKDAYVSPAARRFIDILNSTVKELSRAPRAIRNGR